MIKKLYIETYGCQMNISDSEVVVAILQNKNYKVTESIEQADLILVNTCSIRENAEQRVRARINEYKARKVKNPGLKIGIIGCMAERLKDQLLDEEKMIDLVAGPDAYRDLPLLLEEIESGLKGINTLLKVEETYGDILPVRLDKNHVSAFVTITRGCDNFCSYCVVPLTRGRERSRNPETIINEAKILFDQGYSEITLLGQNVNSYLWHAGTQTIKFEELLASIAEIHPDLRVRFATSHPKDLSDNLLITIRDYPNICRSIHLPVQSGSSEVLRRMNRKYNREWYMERINAIRNYVPEATVSTDIITGFPGETEEDHFQTLSLMEWAGFDFAFMFKYSERPGTPAEKQYKDDVPNQIKISRLNEIIKLQNKLSLQSKKNDLGKVFEVLVEGTSKKSDAHLFGRTSQNKVVVFNRGKSKPGDYINALIVECTSATLIGRKV